MYNLNNPIRLTIVDELQQALFVAQFESPDVPSTKARLLAASPLLGAGEIYAAVNDYTLTFEPCNQVDFRHLVTVYISNGNSVHFGILHFLTTSIGKFIKDFLSADNKRMSAVVETTLKVFPPREQFQLCGTDITTIEFNYEGRNLCCCFCFSYRHFAAACRHPRSSLFSNIELVFDVIPGDSLSDHSRAFSGASSGAHAVSTGGNRGRPTDTFRSTGTPSGTGGYGNRRNRPRFRTLSTPSGASRGAEPSYTRQQRPNTFATGANSIPQSVRNESMTASRPIFSAGASTSQQPPPAAALRTTLDATGSWDVLSRT